MMSPPRLMLRELVVWALLSLLIVAPVAGHMRAVALVVVSASAVGLVSNAFWRWLTRRTGSWRLPFAAYLVTGALLAVCGALLRTIWLERIAFAATALNAYSVPLVIQTTLRHRKSDGRIP